MRFDLGRSRRLPRHRRPLVAAAVAVGALLAASLGTGSASATPVRGQTGWSVLLCKYSDVTAEPQNQQFFRDLLTTAGNGRGGLADWFAGQSSGRVTLDGSIVRGWFTMSTTKAQAAETTRGRDRRIQDCVDAAARGGYTVPAGHRTIAITNDRVDSGSAGHRVLLDPGAWNIAFAGHEMLHGYGLGHSFSNDPNYRNVSWAQIGEYDDPWDQMSAMNVFGVSTTRFGTTGVGLGAYHRDEMGWIGRDRILTLGADGVGSRTLTLTPLETPTIRSTPLLVRVPFDVADPYHYYTVEYRRRTGASAGIPNDTVLVHEVRDGTPVLQRQLQVAGRPPATTVLANGVSIRTNWSNTTGAGITVSTDLVQRCLPGFVWREARTSDLTCVSPATRTQVRADNAAAASRWVNGAYGAHTCVNGFVWREAFAGDDVCVTGAQRDQARTDNTQAAGRVARPNG